MELRLLEWMGLRLLEWRDFRDFAWRGWSLGCLNGWSLGVASDRPTCSYGWSVGFGPWAHGMALAPLGGPVIRALPNVNLMT